MKILTTVNERCDICMHIQIYSDSTFGTKHMNTARVIDITEFFTLNLTISIRTLSKASQSSQTKKQAVQNEKDN